MGWRVNFRASRKDVARKARSYLKRAEEGLTEDKKVPSLKTKSDLTADKKRPSSEGPFFPGIPSCPPGSLFPASCSARQLTA